MEDMNIVADEILADDTVDVITRLTNLRNYYSELSEINDNEYLRDALNSINDILLDDNYLSHLRSNSKNRSK